MRFKLYFLPILLVLCVLGVLTAAAQSTIDVYVPGEPAVQHQSPSALTSEVPNSFNKTALVTVPEAAITPTIDGVLSPGEWTDALTITPLIVVNPSEVYMKNDACYLYVAAYVDGVDYFGNANMVNMWFDIDQDGEWDGVDDGNLALPAPGDGYPRYPNNVAAWGYNTLGGNWNVASTGSLRYHRPWYDPGVVIPEGQILVRMINDYVNQRAYIEARIDYINGPVKLQGGVPFNIRIQTYAGDYTAGAGTCQIQGQWPDLNTSYYWGLPATSLTSMELMDVVPPPDDLDIFDVRVADNPLFGSKAYVSGDPLLIEVDYIVNPPPQDIKYRVNVYGPFPSTALATSTTGTYTVNTPAGTATIPVAVNLPIGYYRVEVEADDPWVCGIRKEKESASVLILGPGQIPCSVWPGDVNTDGIVNYGDRQSLNTYIHQANLNPSWLQGYYRLPPGYPEPLAEIEYRAQAAIPWNTPEGCHMDTDGNGTVNSFDYIAIKMNWFRTHSTSGSKSPEQSVPVQFGLRQNFPNPFNPATNIEFVLPEDCEVTITVHDLLGKKVQTLVREARLAGQYTTQFDASGLPSGRYFARMTAIGSESGIEFNQNVIMTLSK